MFNLIFHQKVLIEVSELTAELQAKAVIAFERLEAEGYKLRFPYTSAVRDELFEFRFGNKNIARAFFAFAQSNNIYILRAFTKKTPKIPKNEIQIALNRLKEIKNEQ